MQQAEDRAAGRVEVHGGTGQPAGRAEKAAGARRSAPGTAFSRTPRGCHTASTRVAMMSRNGALHG